MTSLTTATNSFHLPQHTQIVHSQQHDPRILLESAHSCAPPAPQNKSYFNPQTNETFYYETEVKVNEIGILFDYEIRHSPGVTWGDDNVDEESDSQSFTDKASDFFNGFFGGGDDEEDVVEAEESTSESSERGSTSDGENALLELEQSMADAIWLNVLTDSDMSWDENNECMGLVIQDVTMRERGDTLDGADGADTFTGTKLLGLTYQPLDYVNPNGCTIPDSTCTAISGQVSVAYSGTNEYSVIQTVIAQIQDGMDKGAFITDESPVLNVEFQGSGGTAPVGGNGKIIPLNTARGTEEPEEEDDYLSQYGVLFVCLVAILGAGFMAAMFVRYRKRQKRLKEMDEGVEMSEEDYQANLALHEEDDAGKTDAEGDSSMADSPIGGFRRTDSPPDVSSRADSPDGEIMSQVELEVPPVGSGLDSNEVEISLSGSKSYGY